MCSENMCVCVRVVCTQRWFDFVFISPGSCKKKFGNFTNKFFGDFEPVLINDIYVKNSNMLKGKKSWEQENK